MNASTVLVLVERDKLEQDAATGMQLALGHYIYAHYIYNIAELWTSNITGIYISFTVTVACS